MRRTERKYTRQTLCALCGRCASSLISVSLNRYSSEPVLAMAAKSCTTMFRIKLFVIILLLALAAIVSRIVTSPLQAQAQPLATSSLLAAGQTHTCAVTPAGGLRCWGSPGYLLGTGGEADAPTPIDVFGPGSDVKAVVAGQYHTCAQVRDAVKCWGYNDQGQLGDGTTVSSPLPKAVPGLESGVTALAAGFWHTCALVNHRVQCWGGNQEGQLGDGTQLDRTSPVTVSTLGADIRAIGAGSFTSCAIDGQGQAFCWGDNDKGQLGDGSTERKLTPTAVTGLTDTVAIAVGYHHTCAQLGDATMRCWGWSRWGQVGNGTLNTQYSTPQLVTSLSGTLQAITAGYWHTCALTTGGMQCWGANQHGTLGNGSQANQTTPVAVADLDGEVIALAGGARHTCAMLSTGQVQCWGSNADWQLGNGVATNQNAPVTVALPGSASDVATGGQHSCAVVAGQVYCWGRNELGQVFGDITARNYFAPILTAALSTTVQALVGGANHSCAITDAHGVVCWGRNEEGQLGDGSGVTPHAPVAVLGLTNDVQALTAHADHTCALLGSGQVWCWGLNKQGQIGGQPSEHQLAPVLVQALPRAKQIAAGAKHTCALAESGTIYCWGRNAHGQLGNGSALDSSSPITVSNLSNVQTIAAGDQHTCAVTALGAVQCWGRNNFRQLGYQGTDDNGLGYIRRPLLVPGLENNIQAIAAGNNHTCALTSSGSVRCWGDNRYGQLGDGTNLTQFRPITVPGLSGAVIKLDAGGDHTCALLQNGQIQCWGRNTAGQLGNGEVRYLQPIPVAEHPTSPTPTNTPLAPTPMATPQPISRTLVLVYAGLDNNLGTADNNANLNRLINNLEAGMGDGIDVRLMLDAPGLQNSFVYTLEHDSNPFCPSASDLSCGNRYHEGKRQPFPEDTAAPASLYQFVDQGLKAYPNDLRVVLVLLGHGSGWSAYGLPDQPTRWKEQDQRLGGMLWDDYPGDNSGSQSLSTHWLGEALRDATRQNQRVIDLLYLDACSMAMAEVAYEVRDSARYLLASPNSKWAAFPYDKLLPAATSERTGATIGSAWLQIEAETLRPDHYPFTFSLFDLAQMQNLLDKTNLLGAALTSALAMQRTDIAAANSDSDRYESNYDGALSLADSYVDLASFARQLRARFPADTSVAQAAQGVQAALASGIVTQTVVSGVPWPYPAETWAWRDAGGISLYFPAQDDRAKRLLYTSNNLAWSADSQWDEFLQAYWVDWENANNSPVSELPTCSLTSSECKQFASQLAIAQSPALTYLPIILSSNQP